MRKFLATVFLLMFSSLTSLAYFNAPMMKRMFYTWAKNVTTKTDFDLAAVTGHTSVWTGTQHIVYGGATATGAVATLYSTSGGNWSSSTTSTQLNTFSSTRTFNTIEVGGYLFYWGGCENNSAKATGVFFTGVSSTIMSTTNAPSTYTGSTGSYNAWTGSKLIFWGGNNCASSAVYGNTGAIFDPSTNTWSTMGTTNAPIARTAAASVWTGTEFIVWGGISTSGVYQNSGARYNPSTNTWTTMSTTNAPSVRSYASMTFANGKVIVWGGFDSSFTSLYSGAMYDPSTDTWTTMASASGPMYSTAYPSANYAIVFGNKVFYSVSASTFRIFDTTTNTWSTPSSTNAPTANRSATNTVEYINSKFVIWGGSDYASTGYRSGAIYDPSTDSWTTISLTNAPLSAYGFAKSVASNKLYIYGGYNTSSSSYINSGAYFDVDTNTWTAIASPPADMLAIANVNGYFLNDKILFRQTISPTIAYYYDFATNAWGSAFAGNFGVAATSFHVAGWSGNRMFVFGGVSGSTVTNGGALYDPVSGTWTVAANTNAPSARYLATMQWTGSKFIVWGGTSDGTNGLATGALFDPNANSWSLMTNTSAPSARLRHTAVWTGSKFIVWGGVHAGIALSDGGIYDPSTNTWSAISSTGAPSARYNHQAVWTGTHMFIFGGTNGTSRLSSGFLYNPTTDTWTTVSTSNAAPARELFTMTWTGQYAVIVAGKDGASYLFDTYVYNPNGDVWGRINTSAVILTARAEHTAVWTGSNVWVVAGQGSSAKQNDSYLLPFR